MENNGKNHRVLKQVDINGKEEPTYAVYDITNDPWQEVSHPRGFKTKAEAEEYLRTLYT